MACPNCNAENSSLVNAWTATVYQPIEGLQVNDGRTLELGVYKSDNIEPNGERDEVLCLNCGTTWPVSDGVISDSNLRRALEE